MRLFTNAKVGLCPVLVPQKLMSTEGSDHEKLVMHMVLLFHIWVITQLFVTNSVCLAAAQCAGCNVIS